MKKIIQTKMVKTLYPALFTPDKEGGFLVDFPDIPSCYTDGVDFEDACLNADDVLNLTLWNMIEERKNIPGPTAPSAIMKSANEMVIMFKADPVAYKKKYDTKAVKKTLSIPQWLDTLAVEKNVNFSHILQNALKNELNVKE